MILCSVRQQPSLAATVVLALLTLGCSRAPSICEEVAQGTYPVEYVGGVRGSGELTLATNNRGELTAKVTLHEASLESSAAVPNTALELSGTGTCAHGDVRIHLDPSPTMIDGRYRFAGGVLVGMLAPDLTLEAFGFWEARLLEADQQEPKVVSGFWVETGSPKAPKQHAAVN